MATTIVRSLGTFGKLPVPFFGNLNLTVNFVTHHLTALPRFAPWGAGAGLGAVWFVWPALTQDFKAGFGIGITLDEEVAQAKAAEEMNKGGEESGKGVDYSATGALKTFATRQGIKNKVREGGGARESGASAESALFKTASCLMLLLLCYDKLAPLTRRFTHA